MSFHIRLSETCELSPNRAACLRKLVQRRRAHSGKLLFNTGLAFMIGWLAYDVLSYISPALGG